MNKEVESRKVKVESAAVAPTTTEQSAFRTKYMKLVDQLTEEAAILRERVDTATCAGGFASARLAETEFLRALEIVGIPGVKRADGHAHCYFFDRDAAIEECAELQKC